MIKIQSFQIKEQEAYLLNYKKKELIRNITSKLNTVMWIRIRLDPHSFWYVDPNPGVYSEEKTRV